MKVAWVIRPATGGILEHLRHLLSGLTTKYEIVIFGPPKLQQWAGDYRFYPIAINDGIKPFLDLQAITQLSRGLRKELPQLLHMHGLKSVMITVPAAKLLGFNRLLFTAHNCLPHSQSRWYRVTHGMVQRRLLRSLTKVITVSEAVKNDFSQFIPDYRIETIYNGIDYTKFSTTLASEARLLLGIESNEFVVGVVSRLIPEKGINTLLETASLLKNIMPNIRFVIVGDGPSRKQFEQYRDALDLQLHVRFLGHRQDIPQVMPGLDLFVLPSISEGFSISVLEAMAAKLPIIVSNIPSMHEMIVEGRSGYLTPPSDAPSLTRAILDVAKDRKRARAMGEYNYQRVTNLFGIENMVQRTEKQYADLLEKGR